MIAVSPPRDRAPWLGTALVLALAAPLVPGAAPRTPAVAPSAPWVVEGRRGGGARGGGDGRGRQVSTEHSRETLRSILRAGGQIVAGTESPITPHGASLHGEPGEYIAAGLTAIEALGTATTRAAAVLGLPADLGSIEPGTLADLIVVEGDPPDVRNARRMKRVIRNGEVFDIDALMNTPAAKTDAGAFQ